MMMKNKANQNKLPLYIFTILLLVIALEGISYFGIYVYGKVFSGQPILTTSEIYENQTKQIKQLLKNKSRENIYPELGWRVVAGYKSEHHQINSKGLRSNHEYSKEPKDGVLRIAAFGDSFIYANQVSNKDAWSTVIEKKHKNIEILNYGVAGYGTDQAFLRYKKEGKELSPKIVLIGFAPVNIRRNVNRYRRFISHHEIAFFKPRFVLNNKEEIQLLKTPINGLSDYKELTKNPSMVVNIGNKSKDHWYDPLIYESTFYDYSATVRLVTTVWLRLYNRYLDKNRILVANEYNINSRAFKIQVKILEKFVSEVTKDNLIPIIILLPDYDSIQDARSGRRMVYEPLKEYLKDNNLPYEDMIDAFLQENRSIDTNSWFMRGGHYSPKGNEILARWLIIKVVANEFF